MTRPRKPASPFRYFNSSPEVIRLIDRETYKTRRSAALAEWQNLMA